MTIEDLPDMLVICRRASEHRIDVAIALDGRLASGASPVLDDGLDLRDVLGLAQEALDRIKREVEFSALHGRLVEMETSFLQALGALHEKGLALGRGRSVSGVYQPSDEMRRALFHGVPPAPPVVTEAAGNDDE